MRHAREDAGPCANSAEAGTVSANMDSCVKFDFDQVVEEDELEAGPARPVTEVRKRAGARRGPLALAPSLLGA